MSRLDVRRALRRPAAERRPMRLGDVSRLMPRATTPPTRGASDHPARTLSPELSWRTRVGALGTAAAVAAIGLAALAVRRRRT